MCGIAGLMSGNGAVPDDAALNAMKAALVHRGPDGAGTYVSGDTGLVHTRLAVIDLDGGDQPLFLDAKGGRLALVGNGEIYNYLELRADLGERHFATRSDCEPPLHLYARHGTGFADHLRGMYALALHDPVAGRLILSRDPFGIKPLYYAETEKGFAFSSEIRPFVVAGLVRPLVNEYAAGEVLQLQFTTGYETPYQGVFRVQPGETLVVEGGRVVERRFRAALPEQAPRMENTTEALSSLDTVLNDSVGVHQRSDVPYGMFLSGGVDSSVLLAMMHRLNAQPVQAFTVGFPGARVADERDHARIVAKAAGADHHEVEFTEHDFWTLTPKVAQALDDPVADYAILPTYKLAGAVRDAGLKVVLSGEGGDELFGGYGRYRRAMRPWFFGGRAMRSKGIFEGMGVLRDGTSRWRDGIRASEARMARRALSRLQRLQAVDIDTWLPNDLLTKVDRCLMAHGVEGRVPFLDPAVADVAFRLPDRLKLRKGLGKWLLRRWLETGLPAAEPFARKKGFTVPVGEWISARAKSLGPLVAAQPGVAALAHPEAAARLFIETEPDNGKAAWTLLAYALWHHIHVLGAPVAGDISETLAFKP